MRLVCLTGLVLGITFSVASASPLVVWGTTNLGIYASASSSESATYNCSGSYQLTINGMTEDQTVSFAVQPNANNAVVYTRTMNLPSSEWHFSGGDIRCS